MLPPNLGPVGPTQPQIPEFPWPPPQASASQVVPSEVFVRAGPPSLGEIADQIGKALDSARYFERSFFAVPGGFAMVTRLEQINSDGTSKAESERWVTDLPSWGKFSLPEYLRALFTARPGYYRIIVFIVSPEPFAQTSNRISEEEAIAWLTEGANKLPVNLARLKFTDEYSCTALIYEFSKAQQQDPKLNTPSALLGRVHLQQAHLWESLKP
jgi:hypothetical protein